MTKTFAVLRPVFRWWPGLDASRGVVPREAGLSVQAEPSRSSIWFAVETSAIRLYRKRPNRALDSPVERALPAPKSAFEIVAGTPDQLAARLAAEIPMVKDLVARTGIKPERGAGRSVRSS
jgi:hypothetical protein